MRKKTIKNAAGMLAAVFALGALISSGRSASAGQATKTAGNGEAHVAQRTADSSTLQPIEACASGCTLNYGSTGRMGDGTMKAYAFVEDKKTIKEIGVLMSASVLKGLPQNCGSDQPTPGSKWLICQAKNKSAKGEMNDTMVTTLDMPRNAVELANIDKLDISWLPFGHAPEKVWDQPQFDIHFPFRKPTGGQDTALFYAPQVPTTQLPSGYMVLPGSGFHWDTEALQGHSHAADPKTSPEFAGGPFAANFLYIAYNGHAIGYEIYAAKNLLEAKGTYTRNLQAPEFAPGTKYVPTKLKITYESKLNAYRISLYDYTQINSAQSTPTHKH